MCCNNKPLRCVNRRSTGNLICSMYFWSCDLTFDFILIQKFLFRSQMINSEDFTAISALDSDTRGPYLQQNASQSAKTFLNLLSHVSKDQTIQYILVMIDDLLQVIIPTKIVLHHKFTKKKFFIHRRIVLVLKYSMNMHQSVRKVFGVHF